MTSQLAAVDRRLRGAGLVLVVTMMLVLATTPPTQARSMTDRELDSLASAVVRSDREAVEVAFLGSSTTYGSGASTVASRFVNRVVARLDVHRLGPAASHTRVRTMAAAASTRLQRAGLHGINGGQPGATAATYVADATVYGLDLARPACVVHTIGSNDSVSGVPVADYEAAVRTAVRRIDRAARDWRTLPCHVLVHTARRYQVTPEAWALYGAALARVAQDLDRVTLVDASPFFDKLDAAGADPYDLMGSDRTHLTDRGHALLADSISDAIARGLGSARRLRNLDHDRDGLRDLREVRGLHRSGCADRSCRPLRTDPLRRDTDGDGVSDGRELATGHDPTRRSSFPG